MKIAGRSVRASWQQIVMYLLGMAIALRPFAQEHDWADLIHMKHMVEFLQIVLGALILTGARSPIGRKEWSRDERHDKTFRGKREGFWRK